MITKAIPSKILLAIVELGGYPNFTPLYQAAGFQVHMEHTMRKALAWLKGHTPAVIVVEFNYQSGFRDRLSNVESLMAVVQRLPHTQVIVFFEPEVRHQFERLQARFGFFDALTFPIDLSRLEHIVKRAAQATP